MHARIRVHGSLGRAPGPSPYSGMVVVVAVMLQGWQRQLHTHVLM